MQVALTLLTSFLNLSLAVTVAVHLVTAVSEAVAAAAAEASSNAHIPADLSLEKRAARVVAEDSFKYNLDNHCPMPGCDSKGERIVLNISRQTNFLCADDCKA